jgi:lipid A 3-O-deacylase
VISASFVAMHLREPRSRAWAHAAAIARRCALICLCAHSGALPAAEWTLSGIAGAGNDVNLAGVEAQVPSGYGGALTDQWSWSLRWAGDVAYWWARNHGDSAPSLWEMGLTPVVVLRRAPASGVSYYVEGGIGLHLLSHTRIDERGLSTAFQFGEFVGTGVNFGDHGEYGVGVRIQHISNGGIKQPNCGATFGEVRISYRWE